MQNFQHHQYLGHFLKPLVPIHHLEKRKTGKGMMGPQLSLRMPALAATGSPPENCFTPRVCWGICTVYCTHQMKTIIMVKCLRKIFQLCNARAPVSTPLRQCQVAKLWNHPPGCFRFETPGQPLLAFLPPEHCLVCFQSLFVLASYITNAMLKDVGGAGK